MKSKIIITMMLLLSAVGWARAQEELTVYDNTTTNNNVPFYALYADYGTRSQFIIPSDAITDMAGGSIEKLTFYTSTASVSFDEEVTVYLKEVNYSTFADATLEDWSSMEDVYVGTLTVSDNQLEIILDTPYLYGGDNLMIGFQVTNWGTTCPSISWLGEGQAETTALYNNANGSHVWSTTVTKAQFLPKTTFEYTPGGEAPAVVKPKNLTVNYTGGTTAEVSWTSDAEAFDIDVNGTVTENVSSPYTLTDLYLGTTYTIKVRAKSGSDMSDWTNPVSFTTDLCLEEDQCLITFELTDSYGDSWNGNAIKVVDVETGKVLGQFTNENLDGTNGEETNTYTLAVCNGRNIEFQWVNGSYPHEASWVIKDVNGDVITEGTGNTSMSTGDVLATYLVDCTPPTCAKPKDLAVNYEGGIEATVNCTSDAESFDVSLEDINVWENVTMPFTIPVELDLATTYNVKVRANCSATEHSDWTNPVSFKTDNCMPEDMCQLTFTLSDSYGDSWNGASIAIYDYTGETVGDLLASVTISSSLGAGVEQTTTLNFCNGQELAILWQSGNYDDECSYTITDVNGDIVAQNDFELAMAYTIDCTVTDCRRPTDFAASNIGPHSAVLRWTENGEATAWVIEYMAEDDEDITTITVESNPYTLEGLDPETTYYARVTPVCEVDKPSEVISWTTDVATPAPTDLSATPLVTTAEVSWNGFAESYELEYAEGTFGGGWLQYDDGSYATGFGGSTATERTWGVMYPGSMVTADELTKVSIYEAAGYNAEDITINIYSGGDDAPGELLYTQTVTPEAADAFHEITLDSPVEIPQGQNLWITLTETGTYVLTVCDSDEPNNNWVNNGGTWAHLGDVNSSLAGYGWMIRAELSGNDPSTAEWTAVPNPTSPCTLEGLNPETTYTFRVRGDFGDEGMSDWAMMVFTTKAATDEPIDPITTNITSTSATLDWTGYQESYNVQYRPQTADPTEPATIILTAPDMWGDGSGYQMLLDADATAFGTIIPETGGLTSSGDASAETYAEFEYKIPGNADGAMATENIVINNSVSIQIPAGTYDWCITNPTPADRIWIASGNGNVGGRYDNYVFEPGVTYEFTISAYGTNDGVDVVETRPMGEWTTVEGVTNPYELTGLTPGTYYEWQVQGIISDGVTTEWTPIVSFITNNAITLADNDSELPEKNSDIISANEYESVDVLLSGRTLFKDGSWNTLCLPFDVTLEGSPLEGATAKTLTDATVDGNAVNLIFGSEVDELEAGVPYIILWNEGENIVAPTFKNVTIANVTNPCEFASGEVKFIGYYDAFDITTPANDDIYYMKANNTLAHTGKPRTLKAFRAYFQFGENVMQNARTFVLDFGDGSQATSISSLPADMLEGDWYTVSGMKVETLKKGIYISNGKKVVVK